MDLTGKKILIAEDEPELAETMKSMLLFFDDLSQAQIILSFTSEETEQYLIEEQPDITILDLGLGHGLSGLDILKKVKGQIPDKCKIFVYSGSYELQEDCLKAGATAFFEKRINFFEVIEAVRKTS